MNIPKTILEDFKLCGEPFIIRSNRIYTLESAQGVFDNNDFIQFLDKKYPLEKSLLISNLENRYFSLNEKYINSYLQHIIKRDYVSKVESSHAALISQHNIYEQNKLSSVEHFIRSQVVPQYAELAKDFFQVNSDVPSKPKKIKTVSSETFDPDMFRFPDISDLYSEKSILESVMGSFVNSDFIFTLGGRCYVSSTYDNSPSELVKINNKVHSLKYLSSLSNLDKNYKTAIIRKLNSVAKNHGEQLIPKIQKNLDQIKNLESAFEVQDKTDFGSIGYQKVNNDKYRIYINIVPFIAKMRGKFFHFIKTKVGTDFLIKNNS
ncbi:hypothetical protein HON01_09990, partial [Candidatus Woesearchaeota archaeon]|nr:hypothetical protein [Candidatus Woesearchaeota archaeon]